MKPCPAFPNKIQHATREDALAHQKMLVFHDASTGQLAKSKGLHAYRCPHCRAWHVGHDEPAEPMLVWHYTSCRHMDAILESGALKPSPPRALVADEALCERYQLENATILLSKSFVKRYPREVPAWVNVPVPNTTAHIRTPRMLIELQRLLWFSRNQDWEHSVDAPSRMRLEVAGEGLVRFGVPSSLARLRWSDYLERNHTLPRVRDIKTMRGDPTEWLATDRPVPLERVSRTEVYLGGWMPIDDVDGDAFERYLEGRLSVYREARESFATKMEEATDRIPMDYTPPDLPPRIRSERQREVALWIASNVELTEAERIILGEIWCLQDAGFVPPEEE